MIHDYCETKKTENTTKLIFLECYNNNYFKVKANQA